MAASGYTPIILFNSTTTGNTPTTSNLAVGELAINVTDGKLFFNQSGTIKVLANATYATSVSTISFGTTGLTPSTATNGVVTVAGTLATTNGGTGLSSYTAGDLSYFASGTALTKLAIGTSGYLLTSSGTAPQWSNSISIGAGTFTSLTDSGLSNGRVVLAGAGGLLQDSANLTFSSNTLGLVGSEVITGSNNSTYTFSVTNDASGTSYSGSGKRLAFFRTSTSAAADQPGIDIGYDISGGSGIIAGSTNGTGTAIAFWTYDGASWGERGRFAKSGYFGVGTNNPSQRITAVGNIKIAGAQNGNVANLIWTRTDASFSMNNETDLRWYSGAGDTDTPSTIRMTLSSADGNLLVGSTGASGSTMIKALSSVASGGTNITVHNYNDTGGGTTYAGINFIVGSDLGTSAIRSIRTNAGIDYQSALQFLTNPAGATTTPTLKMTINSTGAVVLAGGTTSANGTGITFPATPNPSSNANTLDDYEEGTFTPVDNSGAGLTFTSAYGYYIKVGKVVYVQAKLVYPSTASGLNNSVSGLPFSMDNSNPYNFPVGACAANGNTSANRAYGTGSSFIFLNTVDNTSTNAALSGANINFNFTYIANQ